MWNKIDVKFTKGFNGLVKNAKSIVITSHKSPDDDSISSVLSMYYYLVNLLKIDADKIKVIYTGKKPDRWEYFVNYEKVQFVDELETKLGENDLVIILDASGWMRLSNDEKIKSFKGKTICIDHHQNPEDKFDLHMVVSPFSSCAELIYELFYKNEEALRKEICEILLLGILGDTGNFRYVTDRVSSVLAVSKGLVDLGSIKIEELISRYDFVSENSLRALSEFIRNMEVKKMDNWPDFIFSYITREFLMVNKIDETDADLGESLFARYIKSIKGATWGLKVAPLINGCSYSLRSLPGSVNVREMMERTGFGGGHDRAAGGNTDISDPRQALNGLFKWMKENKPIIS